MAQGPRRRARIAALQALYEADSSQHDALTALQRISKAERLASDSVAFAQELVEGVLERREEIDRQIAAAATAWPVEQLAPIDRNILRLAIREMLGDNGAPVRAIINEAVELAKSFGSDNSAKFVNGVLGAIERQSRENGAGQAAANGR
jgi:N utilization substance protein B